MTTAAKIYPMSFHLGINEDTEGLIELMFVFDQGMNSTRKSDDSQELEITC
jgi:hypothetical protein